MSLKIIYFLFIMIDTSKCIYNQVKNLEPKEYEKIMNKIVVKENDKFDYSNLKIYDNYLLEKITMID